jgi:hypothetical protein
MEVTSGETEGRRTSRIDPEEGGRYLGIPQNPINRRASRFPSTRVDPLPSQAGTGRPGCDAASVWFLRGGAPPLGRPILQAMSPPAIYSRTRGA